MTLPNFEEERRDDEAQDEMQDLVLDAPSEGATYGKRRVLNSFLNKKSGRLWSVACYHEVWNMEAEKIMVRRDQMVGDLFDANAAPSSVVGMHVNQEPREGGFQKGAFAMISACFGCGSLSAKCTAGPISLDIIFVFLSVTLASAKTPFAKKTFSCFLIYVEAAP